MRVLAPALLTAAGIAVAALLLLPRASLVPAGLALPAEGGEAAGSWMAVRGGAWEEPPYQATPRDWEIVQEKVRWARGAGLADRPMGEVVAAIALTFVGTPYEPGTLEVPGPERLVVNLRELDCVTFVETALVLAHLTRTVPEAVVEDRDALARLYRDRLVALRYRGGVLDGYPSRLHYFSEWLSDNAGRGNLRVVTPELAGAVADPRPITFMSSHPHAYPALASDPAMVERIRGIEARLGGGTRRYVPQEGIAAAAGGIRDGDIIAAKSTVEGLDVAHTGFALWREGRLHLLHAPLVGDSVEVSPLPLAERIRGIRGQDGILVARPL